MPYTCCAFVQVERHPLALSRVTGKRAMAARNSPCCSLRSATSRRHAAASGFAGSAAQPRRAHGGADHAALLTTPPRRLGSQLLPVVHDTAHVGILPPPQLRGAPLARQQQELRADVEAPEQTNRKPTRQSPRLAP